jgi:3-oxoacyl-[acyl-carrier-protein] synthase III
MATRIIATGRALPKQTVTNDLLARRLGTSAETIQKKTGIMTRHWASPEESTSSLAIEASKKALLTAGLSSREIDLILVTTSSPDMCFPSTACLVQAGLAAGNIPAFDLNASCSGFLYALSVADQYLSNGSAKHVLIASSEIKTRTINPNDPATSILFADGAGAAILSKGERGLMKIQLGAAGSHHKLIQLPAGGSREPLSVESLKSERHYMQMSGQKLFRTAVKTMERELVRFLASSSLSFDQIDHYIFHQANLRILEALLRRNPIPPSRVHVTLRRFGNTSSSTIPIALDVALEEKKIKNGERVLFSAFGGGVTWGNALINW